MFSATAAEMTDTDQPNSSRSGSISTPGTARKAAAPTSARKVTAATHQAGCTRRLRGGEAGSLVVTPGIVPHRTGRDQWPDSHRVQGSGHAVRTARAAR